MEAWHSAIRQPYHTSPKCEEGKAIPREYLREGKGNRPLCNICKIHMAKANQGSICDAIDG